jgi:CRP/FNR family transcriptional regulator, cyclic AMP receptor protein
MIDHPFFAGYASCSETKSRRLGETVNCDPVYHERRVGATDEPVRLSEGENSVRTPGSQHRCSLTRTVMIGPTYEEKRQIFERHFLLGKLRGDEIDTLLHFARVERYPAGEEIYAKGSPGQSMMAVLRGTAKMTSVSSEGKEIVLNIMQPGEIFGEIALLDGGERSADAVAMTDCEILVIHRRDFMPILEKRADICLILLRILCQRLRQTSEQVEDVLFRHLESRVAKALLHLADSATLHGVPSSPVELHVSQRELGSFSGGSRESVNKILQSWHKAGWIELGKGTIVIRDLDAIARMVTTPEL